MDKEAVKQNMEVYGNPGGVVPDGTHISFARCNQRDVERIEAMTDQELIDAYVGFYLFIAQGGCTGASDFQYRDLMNLELDKRPHISSETILALYDEELFKAQEEDKMVSYSKERFLEDIKEIFG